ncbi:MAG: sulfotransferase [Deltaproteobacteria bacterium]|nr:sulfotransferase [Deltaproteobacteria bacterium]
MPQSEPSLTLDSILDEARQRAGGATDLGGEPGEAPFMEGLTRLLDSLESEGRLNPIGRAIARERVLLHTVNRLLYVSDRERHPGIAREQIVKPVFIIGMPRTGTTILHDILAQDPSNRVPLTWETMFPSPPPEASTFKSDPRIERCAATFPDIDAQIPAFKAMHPMGARLSQECVTMMGEAMCTPLFHNQFRVPAYQDWVDHEADWSHVYAFHQRQLQHLQWCNPGERWVLKTGAHMWGLEHLLRTYPDARIVFTHRDPVKSMTSYASLTALVRSMGSDDVDPIEIAGDWTARIKRVLEHAIGVRNEAARPDAVFCDMLFLDFVEDQFSAVEKIYQAIGLPMTGTGADRMRAFIADNPKGKHGIHRYAPDEFGVKPAAIREAFRPYMERFGLEPEAL